MPRVNDASRDRPGRPAWGWAATLLLWPSLAFAQELPSVVPPTPDFYGAAGRGVKVAWSLDRTQVPEGGEITATLSVVNVANPRHVLRPDLKHKKLSEFQDLFVITDVAAPPPDGKANEVKFTYRLRPRSRQTDRVPTLVFQYYNAAAAAGKQFPVTNTGRPIPITVTAAPAKVAPPPVPLTEPEHLFAIATGPGVLARGWAVPSGAWLVLLFAGPLFGLGWYAAWRRAYPDAARLARMHRSRAARRATHAIRRSGRADDPPAAVAAAVLGYLRTRFPLPPAAVTPSDIGSALAEQGVSPAECGAVAEFFRKCDAARFSPASDSGPSLAADAESLVTRLEAAG